MKIAIVGGGPAGFFAAISAATRQPTAEVVILEATRNPLKKVLISGGGRCNVTHHCFDPAGLIASYPRGSRELRGPFTQFQPRDTVEWFQSRGVKLKTESDGRMFPITDESSTIVDCLLEAVRSAGITLRLGARVKAIETSKLDATDESAPDFEIHYKERQSERYDRVLLATGSGPQGYRFAQNLGHQIIPCVPSLFTFKIKDSRLTELSGVSFDNVEISLLISRRKIKQSGGLLITHWGLSGPAILKLSAWAARELHDCHYHSEVSINFLPHLSAAELTQELMDYKIDNGKKKVLGAPPCAIPRNYWKRVARVAGVGADLTWNHVGGEALRTIVSELTDGRFSLSGKGVFKEEFVTCGGVDLQEVDFRSMQSKKCPGLYFAGELLDIDGVTGGFNFQSAWTTGWIAGRSMVT